MLPEAIEKFIAMFSRLPSVGPRMARRLAFYLINLDKQTFKNITDALYGLKNLDRCPECFLIKDMKEKLCPICTDTRRDKDSVLIVEKETDVLSIERAGVFRGRYLVIGELEGSALGSGQKLRLKHFKHTVEKESGGKIKEIIIATSPSTRGDFLAETVKKELGPLAERITRLGRGVPTGGDIEFADEETLGSAFEGRR